MSPDDPFDRDDLPTAERLVAAPVADVYAAVDDVDRWSTWVEAVVGPVQARDDKTFEMSAMRDGKTSSHRVVKAARGPVHSLNLDVDEQWRVYVRTRPHPSGTHVGLVAEPLGKPKLRDRLSRDRSPSARSARLLAFLDQLAAYVERGREPAV
jgi:hypothetical protein